MLADPQLYIIYYVLYIIYRVQGLGGLQKRGETCLSDKLLQSLAAS